MRNIYWSRRNTENKLFL